MSKTSDAGEETSLARIPLFAGLPAEDLRALEQRCVWRKYRSQEQIISHLDSSDDVYFLTSGKAQAIIYSVTGKAVAYRNMESGDFFGEFAAIDGKPRSASVEADGNCSVGSMSAAAFWQVLETQPAVMKALLRHLSDQVRALTKRIYEFSTLAVNNRIQAELLRLANKNPQRDGTARIEPAPTHAEIASRISTHREAVTRELNRLAQIGVIERKGKTLIVCDMARLTRMVEDATGE